MFLHNVVHHHLYENHNGQLNSSGFPVYVVNPLFQMQVLLLTALPTLVEELEGYSWTTCTAQEESHDLLTVLTTGLVSTTATTLPMLG